MFQIQNKLNRIDGFEHLNFGYLILFRISRLEFRIFFFSFLRFIRDVK